MIELLVVIAIIGLLAGLIVPVFVQAKSASKSSDCISNIRQLMLATALYGGDFDGHYAQLRNSDPDPSVGDANGGEDEPNLGSIFTAYRPYLSTKASNLYCPSDSDPTGKTCQEENPDTPELASYLVNGYFVFGISESQVTDSSHTIFFVERRTGFCDDILHPWFNSSNPEAPENQMDTSDGAIATDRHGVNSNYGFGDTHAKRLVFNQTYSPPTLNLYKP